MRTRFRSMASSRVVLFAVALLAGSCKDDDDVAGSGQSETPAGDAAEAGEPASNLPEADVLLDKAAEAVGGQARLDAVKSFYYRGNITILGQNMEGAIEIWWKEGDFYTTQEMVGIGNIEAGKLGDTVWSRDPINGLRRLSGAEAEQYLWASCLMLAADWKDFFTEAKTVAERELDGVEVYDVELTSASGASVTLSFAADSGLQVAQKFEQVSPLGKMPVSVLMQDYREVEPHGVKIAFKHVTDAFVAKATQEITELQINPEVDTARFGMPTGGAEVVRLADLVPGEDGAESGEGGDGEGSKKKTMMPFDENGKPGKPVPPKTPKKK